MEKENKTDDCNQELEDECLVLMKGLLKIINMEALSQVEKP